jgi:hypothetical protein
MKAHRLLSLSLLAFSMQPVAQTSLSKNNVLTSMWKVTNFIGQLLTGIKAESNYFV